MNKLTVFFGYDKREDVTYQVAKCSLKKHTKDWNFTPIIQDQLRAKGWYTREIDERASTDFSLTRFLTPFLAKYNGWVLFADSDVLFTQDINNIFKDIVPGYAVYVVKHDYIPKTALKMDGKTQHVYPKKNWSSVMLFDCAHPALRKLTPNYVNRATPSELHQFAWIDNDLIGDLPLKYNFLVGEYEKPDEVPTVLHYTLGAPDVFANTYTTDYADLWRSYRDEYVTKRASDTGDNV